MPGCGKVAAPYVAHFCTTCGREPPSQDLAFKMHEFQLHARWAASKLDVLRSRSGSGFKEKLLPSLSAEEKRIYNWFYRHACDWEPVSLLAQQLAIVDAFVTKSEAALLQEYQAHAAPVHAASAADVAVEAGAHAGACSWPLRQE